MNFNGEFPLPEVKILQLLPQENPSRLLLVKEVVLGDATVADAQVPGKVGTVPHLVVVSAKGRQAFHQAHIPVRAIHRQSVCKSTGTRGLYSTSSHAMQLYILFYFVFLTLQGNNT